MSAIQISGEACEVPNGIHGVKRQALTVSMATGRRSSTVLNPRSYVKEELWKKAPVFTGSTCFAPLEDVKNILITGGAGFIACWFARHLVLTYPHYNVVSLDKLDYCATLNNTRILDGRPNFAFEHGDITSPATVKRVLRRHKIDTIFHFAAQSHVDLSFGNSYEFTQTNVFGTHVLLERAREHGINKFIHISTDEVYGDVPVGAADLGETSILAPTNPYSASKAAAEMMVSAYRSSFKLPLITVRANNVYGPHQFPEKIIPKFIMLLQRKQKLLLHGDGSPTRRYLYAGDIVDALDTILHKGDVGQIYNIASKDEISNTEICRRLLDNFGIPRDTPAEFAEWVQHTEDRPFNDQRYATDGSKLSALGWEPKMSFDEGLRTTVDWYRRFGEVWWGDISRVLTSFPVVTGNEIRTKEEHEDLPSSDGEGTHEEDSAIWTT
ncbi:Trifunctional UDP-glucose 4,6-dehydratase/UDP-4-keto-6-deoxy-D-glucose 3,5-epimerase/UDP-4-keto-L-rhamnose-reductase RHM1 [Curvularia clavata]|uniref:Trifunctional UDP-glucose 4,6-dehydratase/UDP-4-keto-6-deoxy-D-glucose 3,5-epimerase/UDP-4-keto-L-rhamnose-reductase RHM1 n=1 Tax=Curvularia clavata TaxID=95742 RepID=A0A9Q8Z6R0_CURCL|nr:Trifunctional UDP-glucose 4,6-dehydratase/UDP-4-keto-6-deoxy-D-glucose 3,5-epimerase/UDP-4-keto-L-rhamnose-reductase RHM1 [Curvularia clavata]